MSSASPARIAQLLTEAPGWARVGLTAPTERVRHAAAETLGRWVSDRLDKPERPGPADGQRELPL